MIYFNGENYRFGLDVLLSRFLLKQTSYGIITFELFLK